MATRRTSSPGNHDRGKQRGPAHRAAAEPGIYEQAITKIGTRITPQPNGCWEWTGRLNADGYGITPTGHVAHRFVYELLVDPIPDGHVLHHQCENRACCNPEHVTLMTNGDHVAHHHAQRRRAS